MNLKQKTGNFTVLIRTLPEYLLSLNVLFFILFVFNEAITVPLRYRGWFL
jgi:hypothetical protein